MADYQHMYHILCDAASRALDAMADTAANDQARAILQSAWYEAEELYIAAEEE